MGKLDTAASAADALELKGSPESERQTVDPAYRNHLVLAEQKSQDDFDKTVLSLSGGALGISFAFVKDMIGENPIVHPTWLWLSWVIWAFSSLAVLASFFMSHLARAAVASGARELQVNLLTGDATPISLLTPPIAESIQRSVAWFPRHLAGERVDVAHLKSASLVVQFKLDGTVAASGRRPPWTVPFECVVSVEDDRGKLHEGHVEDMWHVSGDA